jgi:dCTP diphosphatase
MKEILDIKSIVEAHRRFSEARDWQQFHSPKNLSMALMVETAELMEHFQWLKEEKSFELTERQREAVALEMADVLIYFLRLSDLLKIDLDQAVSLKMKLNEEKYPVEKARGLSTKYTEL